MPPSSTAAGGAARCDRPTRRGVRGPRRGVRRWVPSRSTHVPAGGGPMSGSVIVAGARTPIGRLLGGLKELSAADLGGVAIKGALEKAGRLRRPGRLRDHGPGHPGRRRPEPRPHGRRQGRHPDVVPSITINKVCLSGVNAIATGRPAHPRRRARDRRGRRHGVDDQRPAPAAEVARGLQVRRRTLVDSMAYDALFDQSTDAGDGRAHRGLQRRRHRPDPRGAGRVLRRSRTRRPPRPGRTASSTTRSSRSRSRSARATRSWSARTRACAATPPSSRWASCARRSARTAPSPPARPRRSPTAPARSS